MSLIVKSLGQPDEPLELPKGRVELVHLGYVILVRGGSSGRQHHVEGEGRRR